MFDAISVGSASAMLGEPGSAQGAELPGGAIERVLMSYQDPRRLARKEAQRKAALEKGYSHKQAAMYAKWAESPFRVLRPYGAASLLSEDDWRQIDDLVIEVARRQLGAVQDLVSRGLTHDLGDIGFYSSTWQKVTDQDAAQVSIDIDAGETGDRQEFSLDGVAVPMYHKTFRFGMRELAAARTVPIDTTHVQRAAQLIFDAEEVSLFNGRAGIVFGGYTVSGYTTHASRTTGSATGAWSVDINTTDNIYPTVRNMVNAARATFHNGPFVLYVESENWSEMKQVYTDGSGQTPLKRILENFPEISDVKPTFILAHGTLVLVEMSPLTVDYAVAQDIITVKWETGGGASIHFRVFTVKVPRIKADAAGQTGVVHYTGA